MIISDLRAIVCAYANREQTDFVRGGQDLLLLGINRAKYLAQKAHDFEYLRSQIPVTVLPVAGVPYPTSPKIKKIEHAFLPGSVLIDFCSRKALVNQNFRRVNLRDIDDEAARVAANQQNSRTSLYMEGQVLKLYPYPSVDYPVSVQLDLNVVLWSNDYVSGTDTDFFLDYGHDYMLYQTLKELNQYMKEPEQIQFNDAARMEAWQAFLKWDHELTSDEPLDEPQKPPTDDAGGS